MGYATVIDVAAQDVARGTYTATSRPTASQVILYLDNTAAELDGILRAQGYTLPIGGEATQALTMLREFNIFGAAAMVEQTAQNTTPQRLQTALKLWDDCRKMLQGGVIELDAAKDTATLMPRYATGNIAATPYFTRTTTF